MEIDVFLRAKTLDWRDFASWWRWRDVLARRIRRDRKVNAKP